jgi:hypothetical protein
VAHIIAHTTKIRAGDDIILHGDALVRKMPRSICTLLSNESLYMHSEGVRRDTDKYGGGLGVAVG